MSNPTTLNLDRIVDISVQVSPVSAPRGTFNQALFIGTTSGVIDTTERLREYDNVADMLTDGFTTDDEEYKAANIYFSQTPTPSKLWIGYQEIGSPAETCLDALTDCRTKNNDWYIAVCLAAVAADHKEIAAYIETATPSSLYGFTTSDADCIAAAPSPDNIFGYLKALDYKRTFGQYATTQDAVYPNNIYAICGIVGYACGQNTGLANSAFTLKFKEEAGVATEPLTTTMVGYIEGKNGNVYLSYGSFYNVFEQGVMFADGWFFDQMINIDMLVNNIQLSVMDLLASNPKVPQTDSGVTQIIGVINSACDQAVNIGFLAAGVWDGVNILNLYHGDVLPKGYICQAQTVASQSAADRAARKAPPIYLAIKPAGAIHSVIIGIYMSA
jgi:hypothetical protein